MSVPVFDPAQAFSSYRKSDAVLIVCQDNEKKTLDIAAVNNEAARISGYDNNDITGKSLIGLLPKRVADTLTEFIEYDDDTHDLQAVLGKVRNFAIKTREGKELPFQLRIIRGESLNSSPWFHLVLVDEDAMRKTNAYRDMLKENFKGHEVLDERTGLANRVSIIKDMEIAIHSVRNKHLAAVFALLDINNYAALQNRYKQVLCDKLHQHIAHICKQKLRSEDMAGTLSPSSIGLILVDAPPEAARMVLNRLRWAISVSPLEYEKEEICAQVNIVFADMDGKVSETDVLNKCESLMHELNTKREFNTLQLAVTYERREDSKDRRKQQIKVEAERRKKSRRKPEA